MQLPAGAFPIAEELAATCLSLPMWPGMTESHVEAVATAIRSF
jgi:dTDP-4-amino-4,6-dideoxygalactose transaminase